MRRHKTLKYKNLCLASSACFVFYSGSAYALNTPIIVSDGDVITLANENINISTTDNTSPIKLKGGSLSIFDSIVLLNTTANNTPALFIETSGYAPKTLTILGSATNKVHFTTSGEYSHAVSVFGNMNNVSLDYAQISALGRASRGISVNGTDNKVSIKNSTIVSDGVGVYANVSSGRSEINLSDTQITAINGFALHLLGANFTGTNFSITTGKDPATGAVTSGSYSSYGVNANWFTKVTLDTGNITTWGQYAHGVWIVGKYNNYNADILDAKNIAIRTHGDRASGVEASGRKAKISNSVIHTSGSAASGLAAGNGGSGTTGGFIDVYNSEIKTEGANSAGILADVYSTINAYGTKITTSGESAVGARSNASGRVNLTDGSSVVTTGDNAHGAYITSGSEMKISGSSIETKGTNAHGVFLSGYNTPTNISPVTKHKNSAIITDSTVSVAKGSALSVRGGSENKFTITGSRITGSGDTALLFSSETYYPSISGQVIPMEVGTVAINADASVLEGDIRINSGTVDYTLANNSVWTGAAHTGANDKILNSLSVDASSRWTISGTSIVNTLTNTGKLAFSAPDNGFKTLTVKEDYTSDGLFVLNTKLGDDTSETDKLIFEKAVTGNNHLQVLNAGGRGAQTTEGIKLIEIGAPSDGSFTLKGDYTHDGQSAVVGGAYAYKLFQGTPSSPTDGDWYLRSEYIGTEPSYQSGAPVYEVYPQFLLGLNALPTMQQRIGNRYWDNAGNRILAQGADAIEAYAPADETGAFIQGNGIWGRMEGSYNKSSPNSSTANARYDFNAYKMQAGIDGLLHEAEQGTLIGGITVHYTHGLASIWSPYDADLGRGRIRTDGYGFGGTLTWYSDNGFYIDNQAQATWYRSDLSYQGGHASLKNGKNNGFGYSLSSEIGKRFTINEHWSLTPQAQLHYSNVDFDSFTDVFGADVSRERAASLQGRLGFSAEYQKSWHNEQGGLNRSSVYGIANLYNEFLNGTRVDVASVQFTNKSERLWAGIGLGGSYNWNDDKYSVYCEGSVNTSLKNFGDSYAYKGTVGFRVKW